MPNWVDNTLTITGKREEIAKIKKQLREPYQETIDSYDHESKRMIRQVVTHNEEMSFWNIIRPPANKVDEYHTAHGWADGKESGNTEYNWYNFNIREWGCKWDASNVDLSIDDEDELVYTFITPWSPPISAIIKLSEQYPTTTLSLRYEEEQGWGGIEHFYNGEQKTEETWDIPESHADYKALDRECVCEYDDDQEEWFADCPREKASIR
jgi:Ferredoxin-like domain in Api92-like protein